MTTTIYRIVTYNFGPGMPGDLDDLAQYADIIALQEVGDRTKEIRGFLRRHPGWAVYAGTLPGANADRLLVNVDKIGPATVIDHHGVDKRWVGKGRFIDGEWSAAGPMFSKPKPITEYVLHDGTRVFNIHTMPSVTKSEKVLGTKTYNARRKHHHDYLAALLAVTDNLPGDVPFIVCGDLNSGKDFELNRVLIEASLTGWTLVPTMHGDPIDHVLNEAIEGVSGNKAVTVSGTHSDHLPVLRTVTVERADTVPPLLTPPYVGPAKFHGGSTNKPIKRLVLHATVSACEPGMARSIARYFRETVTRPSSAHYIIDPDESVQVVYDSIVAYHAPPNEHSLAFEMCFMPTHEPDGKWKEDKHHRMLLRTVRLVAEACVLYDIPPTRISVQDLRDDKEGVCDHKTVSDAFHQTDHWDVGDFPWTGFMKKLVRMVEVVKKEQHPNRKAH